MCSSRFIFIANSDVCCVGVWDGILSVHFRYEYINIIYIYFFYRKKNIYKYLARNIPIHTIYANTLYLHN